MPAAEWIALSMQLCNGWKQPSIVEFAALTIVSALKAVISPLKVEPSSVCKVVYVDNATFVFKFC